MSSDRPRRVAPRRFGRLVGAARKAGVRVLGPLGQLGRSLEPAARLLGADGVTARSWIRNVHALQEALGGNVARAYGDLLVAAVGADVLLARGLAGVIPDQLARLAPAHRLRYLVAIDWTISERPSAAVAVAENLAPVLPGLSDEALRSFILEGSSLVASSPEKAASFLRGESGEGRRALQSLEGGLPLEQVRRSLELYAMAHCDEQVRVLAAPAGTGSTSGHPLRLAAGGSAFTNGHDIHLPARVGWFGDQRDFLVYRICTALCAGYLEFGTFELRLDELPGQWPARRQGELELQRLFRGLGNRSLGRDLYQVFEDQRVEARLRAVYPGLSRDLDRIRVELPGSAPPLRDLSPVDQVVALLAWHGWSGARGGALRGPVGAAAWAVAEGLIPRLEGLREPGASAQDSAALLVAVWPDLSELMRTRPPQEAGGRAAEGSSRGAADRDPRGAGGAPGPGSADPAGTKGDRRAGSSRSALLGLLRPERRDAEQERLDEAAMSAPRSDSERPLGFLARRAQIKQRRAADYEEMDDWLSAMPGPAGGLVDRAPSAGRAELPAALREGVELEALGDARAVGYPEWDASIGDYKPSWVLLREYPLQRGSREFVDRVMQQYRPQIQSLRRQFEALRPEQVALHRGLPDGDALDLDRVVEACTVRRAGGNPSDRLYLRHERSRRDVAVAFLLDMSSSTNEMVSGGQKRIIEVEKEALVLIAEAIDAIGDPFAIWGFSGYGRDQVAFYQAKRFDQPYDQAARERIGSMSWKMENRDGAAIRHATRRLLEWPARIRLLVLLSDGKPLDCGCDRYSDAYAQEDTRQALLEARKAGLHPFCITVDPHSRDYLRQMYGEGAYTIIDQVEALPLRIPRLYRQLTR